MRLTRTALRSLPACLVISLAPALADAGEIRYLLRNERFCDIDEQFCMRGSLRYEVNPRILRLSGRVQKTSGRGLLRIRLAGSNRLDHRHTTAMEIQLRGAGSEIVDYRMIPDHPDVENWEITLIEFEPGELAPPKESREPRGEEQ